MSPPNGLRLIALLEGAKGTLVLLAGFGVLGLMHGNAQRSAEQLVRHFHLGHGPGYYVRAAAGVREYLLCEGCGAVRAVDPAALDKVRSAIRREFGYEARFTHFPIAGLCPDCRKA